MSKLQVNVDGYKSYTIVRLLKPGDLFLKSSSLYRLNSVVPDGNAASITNLITSKQSTIGANDLVSPVKLEGFNVSYINGSLV